MFKKFVLATTLGLCLFGVSFGQDRDQPGLDAQEAQAAEREANKEVKVAMGKVVQYGAGIVAGRLANPVTPLNKGEKDNERPEPKASPQRDSGSKGGNSGSSRGGGRKSGPN